MGSPAVLEVAEAMYQAARGETPAKTPDALDALSPAAQRRFLNRAAAAIAVTGPPPVAAGSDSELLRDLAEHLAWKLNHPMQLWDGVRGVLERYAQLVGEEGLSSEVREAMTI